MVQLGRHFGRVMEAEVVEQLALGGGLLAVLSVVDLVISAVILWQGAEKFRKAHHEDFETALDIFSEASEYWQEHRKPFWLFLAD